MKIHFIFTLVFSFMMSFLLSAWVTYLNLGLSNTFVQSWLTAFINAWPAAFFSGLYRSTANSCCGY